MWSRKKLIDMIKCESSDSGTKSLDSWGIGLSGLLSASGIFSDILSGVSSGILPGNLAFCLGLVGPREVANSPGSAFGRGQNCHRRQEAGCIVKIWRSSASGTWGKWTNWVILIALIPTLRSRYLNYSKPGALPCPGLLHADPSLQIISLRFFIIARRKEGRETLLDQWSDLLPHGDKTKSMIFRGMNIPSLFCGSTLYQGCWSTTTDANHRCHRYIFFAVINYPEWK